jgi:hypothetical protein
MNRVVFRVKEMRHADLVGAQIHQQRQGEIPANVDQDRIYLNRQLVGKGKDLVGDVQALVDKYGLPSKATTLLAAEFVLSAGADYFDRISPGWEKGHFSPAFENWVNTNTQWLQGKYGEGLVNAVLHLDEDGPHIHAEVVPIVTYERAYRRGSKSVTKIHYRREWGDDMGDIIEAREAGRSHEDTKLGRLQTEYANYLQAHGIDLQRGRDSVRTKHKEPDHEQGRANEERKRKAVEKALEAEKAARLRDREEHQAAIAAVKANLNQALRHINKQDKELGDMKQALAIQQGKKTGLAASMGLDNGELSLAMAKATEEDYKQTLAGLRAQGIKVPDRTPMGRWSGEAVIVTDSLILLNIGKDVHAAWRPAELGGWPQEGDWLTILATANKLTVSCTREGQQVKLEQSPQI